MGEYIKERGGVPLGQPEDRIVLGDLLSRKGCLSPCQEKCVCDGGGVSTITSTSLGGRVTDIPSLFCFQGVSARADSSQHYHHLDIKHFLSTYCVGCTRL